MSGEENVGFSSSGFYFINKYLGIKYLLNNNVNLMFIILFSFIALTFSTQILHMLFPKHLKLSHIAKIYSISYPSIPSNSPQPKHPFNCFSSKWIKLGNKVLWQGILIHCYILSLSVSFYICLFLSYYTSN